MRSSGSPVAVSISTGDPAGGAQAPAVSVEAAFARHHHVEDQQVEGNRVEARQRLLGITRR